MRTICIGDVHGCLDELAALVDKLGLVENDSLVFMADFLDRGPHPVEVVRFVRDLARRFQVKRIKGNHEEKALRWLRHEEKVAAGLQPKNPMKAIPPERQAEWRALDAEDRAFLADSPLVLQFEVGGEPWVAVHGGLLPGRDIDRQVKRHADEIIRLRWVDEAGKHVPMLEGSTEQPPGSFCWMERFDQPFNVVCGHAIHCSAEIKAALAAGTVPEAKPRVDKTAAGYEVWSIDTGCYGGGRLTALVLDHDRPGSREIVSVPAARAYYALRSDGS
jgi:hypothetical protein